MKTKLVVGLVLLALAALPAPAAHRADAATQPEAAPRIVAAQEAGGDEGPDILQVALLTTAATSGAAALATLAYLFRRAVGYDIHRPPEEGDQAGEHH